jgi:hypothetical protein
MGKGYGLSGVGGMKASSNPKEMSISCKYMLRTRWMKPLALINITPLRIKR